MRVINQVIIATGIDKKIFRACRIFYYMNKHVCITSENKQIMLINMQSRICSLNCLPMNPNIIECNDSTRLNCRKPILFVVLLWNRVPSIQTWGRKTSTLTSWKRHERDDKIRSLNWEGGIIKCRNNRLLRLWVNITLYFITSLLCWNWSYNNLE